MRWKKYTINTTTEAEDLVSLMLSELGVGGVQIEDNIPLDEADTRGMFVDILPELPPDDGTSRVSFFLHMAEEDSETDSGEPGNKTLQPSVSDTEDNSYTIADRIWTEKEAEELILAVREGLKELAGYSDIGEGSIEAGETEDTDWMNKWKEFFRPFVVEDILIKPSWEEIPEEYSDSVRDGSLITLEIDPGSAFGTGTHETTRLCISMIRKYIRGGERVLDIGTGSGILGIAALKSGAESVTATDLDPVCVDAVKDNLAHNSVPDGDFELIIGNIIDDEDVKAGVGEKTCDAVIANILAPVIVTLIKSGTVLEHIKPGGIFITSGIIDEKEQDVLDAFNTSPGWTVIDNMHMGEWVSITARAD